MKTLFFFILTFCSFQLFSQETTYRNPVIPGDYPDPTVIRVGDTYYAAGTSSEWALPYRLYESKDLINWTYLGPLLKEMPDWTMGSYWAPELFYHKGTYFVYYTARRKTDRKSYIGVATTKDIKKGFTDHGLIIEWTNEAIDAFVIELDGKLYITWKAYGLDQGRDIEILGSELSPDGLKLKGEVFSLITANRDDWEAGGAEGQCLVKHGEYIYMFYAGNGCCGPNCNYMTGVARAKFVKGPWEKYSGNPILHSSDQWRCPGHGTLVTTPGQRYFLLYHAYNAATNIFTGRQGLLDEILWDKKTGWPYFRYGKTPSLQAEAPYSGTIQKEISGFEDRFSSKELDKEWTWDVSQKPVYELANGYLSLIGRETPTGTFLGVRPRKSTYFLSAETETSPVQTGICLYGTKDNAVGISSSDGKIELWKVSGGQRTVLSSEINQASSVMLFVNVRFGQYCQFGYFKDGKRQNIGEQIHVSDLPQWDRAPMAGIQVRGATNGQFKSVSIKY
ncbi:MAG: glycoside hydrolase family 43 protein [Bacteroidales bacterium]|jgi:beta-xylosidase|nr:glycoside hydrolase family 43 protein [Bacteroidales bacterium]